ncbi:fluoride efflux transporter CrcB [Cochlodiniinecator piscidefendens]|uniref:fluoride efflux transporter CrcB n=1 Tax=Cochlodiniinecator piscidefendens TaxID=2715756 RepID=UPI001408D0D5|nr:fluoride efflux transporter CrcB [Cochlodiniinecator piscidefendens]
MTSALFHLIFALGGGLGAVGRHYLTQKITHKFPVSTLIINVSGCFLLGLALAQLSNASPEIRQLAFGFCGGFTTFSSFAYQTLDLHRAHTVMHAAANIIISLLACLMSFWAGHALWSI